MCVDSTISVLPAGTILENRYRILGLLGQGGMSRVYLAEHTHLNVRVAIKENLQTGLEAQTQFQREAQILARLSHPNLPKVTDHFIDATTGRQYLVMEYVEGEDLDPLIKRAGPLPEATALAWIRQILDALEYLHHQQPPIIHRDVKPGNIKITPEGKAVLVDFGIAKTYDPRQATLTGARAVTPGYAPPEQYGLRTTERSDIYGLGATLYTMLTGRVPPEAPLRMSGEDALAPPSQIVPGKVSPPTEGAILRAMELETSKRWQNVAQLRAALEGRGAAPRSEPAPIPISKPTVLLPTKGAPSATLLLAVIAIGVMLIGGLTVVSFLGRDSSRSGATHIPTYTPKPTTVLPTATRNPTSGRWTPTWTATVPTPTAVPQITPTATRPPETPTTMPTKTSTPRPTSTAVPAVKRPWFGPLSFCLQIDANNRCINPTSRLPAGTTKFYVSWEFADIPDGTSFDRIWYYNGKELKQVSVKWDSGGSPTGVEFTWYQYNAGFATGEYRVDMYIDGELLRSGSVQIGP